MFLPLILGSLLSANPLATTAPPEPAAAPSSTNSDAEKAKLEQELARELGSAAAPSPSSPANAGQTGGNPLARLLMLPDISAIGNFALAYDSADTASLSPRGEADPVSRAHQLTPLFQELEVGLQSVVDPYARADIFLAFSPEGAELEEASLTTLALPAGLQLRGGTFHSAFGRLNQQHAHAWSFIDTPLAQARLIGAEQLGGPGVDLSWLMPLPWFAELHLAGQSTTPAFEETAHRTGLARLSQFFELSEAATLGIGLSTAALEDWGNLGGVDLFLKFRPPSSRGYVALQGELFGERRLGQDWDQGRAGGYAQVVWRANPFWETGVRYERAPAEPSTDMTGTEQRVSLLAAWLPSEFQRIRLQLSYDRLPDGRDVFESILHAEFTIGAHGAHPF
jgi:hypothetical protein